MNDRAGSRCFGDSLVHSPSAAAPPRSQTPVTLADANITAARGGLADSRETNKQPQLSQIVEPLPIFTSERLPL